MQVLYDSRGSNGAGPPLEFDTGVDAVPEAVDMCIRLMTPTEVASVTAAPKYAYQGRTDRPEVNLTADIFLGILSPFRPRRKSKYMSGPKSTCFEI